MFLEIGGNLGCERGLACSRASDNKHQSGAENGVDIRVNHFVGKRVHEGHDSMIVFKPDHMMVQCLNGFR